MSPANSAPPGFSWDVPGGTASPDNPKGQAGRPPEPASQPDDFLPALEPGQKSPAGSRAVQQVHRQPMPVAAPPTPPPGDTPPQPAPATVQAQVDQQAPPGQANLLPPGFSWDKVPHYETPQEVADNFDYNDSALKHVMPEKMARQVVKIAARTQGGYEAFADKAVDTALFFMSQHARDAAMTWTPGVGDAEWQNRIAQYQAQKAGTEAAHPVLTAGGAGLGYAGEIAGVSMGAEAGVTLPAMARVGGAAAKMAWPLVSKAAIRLATAGMYGIGASAGYKAGQYLWHEISK